MSLDEPIEKMRRHNVFKEGDIIIHRGGATKFKVVLVPHGEQNKYVIQNVNSRTVILAVEKYHCERYYECYVETENVNILDKIRKVAIKAFSAHEDIWSEQGNVNESSGIL